MALTESEGMGTTMLVQPSGVANGGFGNGFGGDGWWILLLFILLGGNNGFGGGGWSNARGRYSYGDTMESFKKLMDNAPDEQTKAELNRMMQRYE